MVGTARFELATPCTPCKCATRLRYAPIERSIIGVPPIASDRQQATDGEELLACEGELVRVIERVAKLPHLEEVDRLE